MSATEPATSTPKLKNPPVIEVLCEIRAEPGQSYSIIPGAFFERIKERYARSEVLPFADIPPEVMPPNLQFNVTHRFRALGSPYLVQVGPKVCTVNSVKPYPGFEEFKSEIRWAFDHYKAASDLQKITRIGLRYINQIPILPGFGAKDIVNFKFEIAKGELQPKEAVLRSVTEIPPLGALNLVVSTARTRGENLAPMILLDLDLYCSAAQNLADDYLRWLEDAHAFQYATFRRMVSPDYLTQLDKVQ